MITELNQENKKISFRSNRYIVALIIMKVKEKIKTKDYLKTKFENINFQSVSNGYVNKQAIWDFFEPYLKLK